MSNSVRPHRGQPTRLFHPWDSPGSNTGVGCHFFLQCMKVKSESEVCQSCPTLRNPMDCRPPGSSVHGIVQARELEWGAIAFVVLLLLLLSVRCIYFHSCFKVVLSVYLQCRQPHTCPCDHCSCFCSPVLPCAAGQNLLGRCLCGSFCLAVTCVGFPQPP